TTDILLSRLDQRHIKTQYMRGYYLKDRMAPARVRDVAGWLDSSKDISTDDKPIVAVRALSFQSTRTGSLWTEWMDGFMKWGGWLWALVLLLGGMVYGQRKIMAASLWSMGMAGFTQMAFQVTVIFGVQAFLGHGYALVGVLSAGFMLGAFMGTRWGKEVLGNKAMLTGVCLQIMLAFVIAACWLWWPGGLLIVPVLAGVAGGILFGVYVACVPLECAGYVYAADLLGAALGALMVGVFLVPIWGVGVTMMFLGGLNMVMLLGHQGEKKIAG
ncbi:MAG: hypothetical protein V2A70_05885, partial [Candidatus Omnitrophota bacterium]